MSPVRCARVNYVECDSGKCECEISNEEQLWTQSASASAGSDAL